MVHHTTGEVYGHVVAVDVFRDIYVVPIETTLQDIMKRLVARGVSLPTAKEVEEWHPGKLTSYSPDFIDSGYSTKRSSPLSESSKFKRTKMGTSHCGRHGNDWLFGGFSVTEKVKDLLKDDEEE